MNLKRLARIAVLLLTLGMSAGIAQAATSASSFCMASETVPKAMCKGSPITSRARASTW